MTSDEQIVCEAEEIERLIAGMGRTIWDERRRDLPFYLIGVRSRGVPLAQRLAQELTLLADEEIPVGAVDITLYRDDFGRGRRWPVLRGTEITFPVDGARSSWSMMCCSRAGRFARRSTRSAIWAGRDAFGSPSWSIADIANCRSSPTSWECIWRRPRRSRTGASASAGPRGRDRPRRGCVPPSPD